MVDVEHGQGPSIALREERDPRERHDVLTPGEAALQIGPCFEVVDDEQSVLDHVVRESRLTRSLEQLVAYSAQVSGRRGFEILVRNRIDRENRADVRVEDLARGVHDVRKNGWQISRIG